MSKKAVYFYLSKMKLVILFILYSLALNIALQFTYLSWQEQSFLWIIAGLGFAILYFKLIWSHVIKKWLQNKPYLIMSDTYLVVFRK